MSNPATMALDWSNLLPDLLQLIGKKITFLSDFIRFGAACRPWQTAYSLLRGHHLPLQLPWLMLPYQSDGNGNGDSPSTRLFYDLSTSKIHKLNLPQTCGVNVSICESGYGWFVLQKGHEVSLLNPITGATISLPKFRGDPHALGLAPIDADEPDFFFNFFVDDDFCSIQPDHAVTISKAILTSSPGDQRDPSCRVFVCTYSVWPLAFCDIGDEFWTVIEFHPEFHREIRWGIAEDIYDISYSNGFLYAIDHLGTVTRYDIDNTTRTLLGGSIEGQGKRHLVQGVSGDILLIEDIPTYVNEYWNETKHIVYKLSNDDENGECEWIQVTDVGQNVLFVGMGMPPHAFSLSSANLQLPEWGANCFYFWEREEEGHILWHNHNIKMERLDDGTVTDITGDLGIYELGPRLQCSLWLTPSML